MFSAVPCRPLPSPAVLCSYLPSPGRSCLRSWGSSSLLMTAVLGIQGRGRTTFCRPVSSGGLGSPPAGPYGAPGRLRTLRRPLQVDEICHAVAIRIGSNDLASDDIPAMSTLLDCCQGLVTVDKGASTVRLIHFTLQEHLCTHPDLFHRAHSTMAETCLTYLNFQHIKDYAASPSPCPRDTPFLRYSSLHWGTHMRIELSDRAKEFALGLLCQFDGHISAESLWKSINGGSRSDYCPGDKPFSGLHCISYFGIPEVTNTLIKTNRWDVNQRDCAGVTPLILAARYGHEEVVRLLLGVKNIEPDQKDTGCGRTALSWAAGNGHEGVARLFLGPRFVNPGNICRRWGKAPRVARLLFGRRYINPDSPSESCRTPLSWVLSVMGYGQPP